MKVGSVLVLALVTFALAPAAAEPMYQAVQQPSYQQENQNACINDAMTVCSQYIPDRSRVASCLINNRRRISAPCRAQLAHWRG